MACLSRGKELILVLNYVIFVRITSSTLLVLFLLSMFILIDMYICGVREEINTVVGSPAVGMGSSRTITYPVICSI